MEWTGVGEMHRRLLLLVVVGCFRTPAAEVEVEVERVMNTRNVEVVVVMKRVAEVMNKRNVVAVEVHMLVVEVKMGSAIVVLEVVVVRCRRWRVVVGNEDVMGNALLVMELVALNAGGPAVEEECKHDELEVAVVAI